MIEWTKVETQADADALMKVFGGFHDACIREAHLATGYWVAEDLHMRCAAELDNNIQFLVQRQFTNPAAVLLLFEEVTRFNLVPATENMDSIILDATVLVRDGTIYWSVEGGWAPDGENCDAVTWISAKRLRWRAVDWLGEELRLAPK